jgi:hypothetical protein
LAASARPSWFAARADSSGVDAAFAASFEAAIAAP